MQLSICLLNGVLQVTQDSIVFYLGIVVLFVGLGVWVRRPNSAPGRFEIEIAGVRVSFDVAAFAVMLIGVFLMWLSPVFRPMQPVLPPVIKKIVCTGEKEENCPGPSHDIFLTCGYFGADQEIAKGICTGIKAGVVRLKTVGGNMCGYSLIEVTCPAPN